MTWRRYTPPMPYPLIEPYEHGWLDVGDGNSIYWEQCGNPDGRPAVVLHGGPGSGCSKGMRRLFDPAAYRLVLFDQRNCGRSTPTAGDPTTDLSANTTWHLVEDIERLRERLGIDRWLVYGNSWGSTLALAYAERYADRVAAMVLAAVTMTRRSEIDWLYRGVGRFVPEQHERFLSHLPEAERGDPVAGYYRLLQDSDPAKQLAAARHWCEWENALVSIDPGWKPEPRRLTDEFQRGFARVVTHYFHHNAWLEEGQLLRDARRLAGIPRVLIHGRMDLGSPLETAWQLSMAWPEAELTIVESAGHSSGDPGMPEAIVAALDRFR